MEFVGTGKRLSDVDLPRIGAMIGVGEDEIHAVLDVEARGRGFDHKDRPVMLFEPHIFYRQLSGSQRDTAVRLGLAYPKWRRDYPRDSYPRLEQAMRINANAALQSASWGLGQIMGFNHHLAGYQSAATMVEAFKRGEAFQLEAMVAFIKAANLDRYLREHDWKRFARGYNGQGYAANNYDKKLEAAFKRWQGIPDTDWKRTMAIVSMHKERDPEHTVEPATEIPGSPSLWAILASIIARVFK